MRNIVHIVDDSEEVRHSLNLLLRAQGLSSRGYPDAEQFLDEASPGIRGCVLADIRMPRVSGFELLERMRAAGYTLPVIMMTGHGDVPMAVRAIKGGALDFLEKPFTSGRLVETVRKGLELDAVEQRIHLRRQTLLARLSLLSERQRVILHQVANGQYNKVIAAELGVSVSTIESERQQVQRKLRATNLYELVEVAEMDLERA